MSSKSGGRAFRPECLAAILAATLPVSKFGLRRLIVCFAKRLLIGLLIFLEVTSQHHHAARGADDRSIIFGSHF
jgi:hypothetical protein